MRLIAIIVIAVKSSFAVVLIALRFIALKLIVARYISVGIIAVR